MQLILISGVRAKTRSVTLGPLQCFLGFVLAAGVILLASALFYYVTLSSGLLESLPFLRNIVVSQYVENSKEKEKLRQQNIDTMASRIGDLQAKLLEIDTMTKRLTESMGRADKTGAVPVSAEVNAPRGGPLVLRAGQIDQDELKLMVDQLLHEIDLRADYLIRLENQLTTQSVRAQLFPGQIPVEELYMTSSYGYRRDPFNGRGAFHSGVDFAAPTGTPILAAASGVVRYAEYHPQYGYMIDLDHGDGLVTRYAHCSVLYVKTGEFVR